MISQSGYLSTGLARVKTRIGPHGAGGVNRRSWAIGPLAADRMTGKPFPSKDEGATAVIRGTPPRGEKKNASFNVRYEVTVRRRASSRRAHGKGVRIPASAPPCHAPRAYPLNFFLSMLYSDNLSAMVRRDRPLSLAQRPTWPPVLRSALRR
jgi:hypothetical protein